MKATVKIYKIQLDNLKVSRKELPNWYCPYCNQTNRDGWPFCIDCQTPKPTK